VSVAEAVHRVEMLMGTAIAVDVAHAPSDVDVRASVAKAFAWFDAVDRRFSTYKPDSEVCRIDRGELRPEDFSDDMRTVLDASEQMRVRTGGYFDVYANRHLDPSGYVKGWSVQVASDRLLAAGLVNHCINAGGDVRVRGVSDDGEPWRVGIRHPWQPDKVAWVVAGSDLAVATSGTYERGLHVIDPFTGQPASFLRSVTVTGPDLAVADAYATAAVAMGDRGLSWLAALDGYESAAVTERGDAFRSDRLPAVSVTRDGEPASSLRGGPGQAE
jgi:thiamine biosynthesis lipoprotein